MAGKPDADGWVRTPSSNLYRSRWYRDPHNGVDTLEVEFLSGAVYQYYDVPRRIFEGLVNAFSHGVYLHRHVKTKGYDFKKIQP